MIRGRENGLPHPWTPETESTARKEVRFRYYLATFSKQKFKIINLQSVFHCILIYFIDPAPVNKHLDLRVQLHLKRRQQELEQQQKSGGADQDAPRSASRKRRSSSGKNSEPKIIQKSGRDGLIDDSLENATLDLSDSEEYSSSGGSGGSEAENTYARNGKRVVIKTSPEIPVEQTRKIIKKKSSSKISRTRRSETPVEDEDSVESGDEGGSKRANLVRRALADATIAAAASSKGSGAGSPAKKR